MRTLPLRDEHRRRPAGSFAARAEGGTPWPVGGLPLPPRAPAAPSYLPLEPPAKKVDTFVQFLMRVKRGFEEAGERSEAALAEEVAAYLNLHKEEDEAADSDANPIFAVAAAYIAVLTTIAAVDEATAAQALARRLMRLGHEMPKRGGDTRGWKRLLLWRDRLERRQLPVAMTEVYRRALEFARHDWGRLNVGEALEHALRGDDQPMRDPGTEV